MWGNSGWGGDDGWYKNASAGVVFSLTNVDSAVDITNSTTVNFSSKSFSFGAADPNRIIVVGLWGRTADTTTPTTVTIGGVTAALVAGSKFANLNTSYAMFFQAPVPLGTAGGVSITAPSAIIRSGVGVFRLITTTPAVFSANGAADGTGTLTQLSASVTVPGTGGGIGLFSARNDSTNVVWTNATKSFDGSLVAGGGGNVSGAIVNGTGAVSVTAATASSDEMALSLAAWSV